jgi:UDP-3-O-[3-hydroxymyristoyl] glucosamine N-acyltransferase
VSELSLADIVARLGGELAGDPAQRIDGIGPLDSAGPSTLSFIVSARYREQLAATAAGCVIAPPALRDEAAARGAVIVTADPYLYFARFTQWWAQRTRPAAVPGIHSSAVVDAASTVHPGATVSAMACIEAGAVISDGAVIGAQSYIGRNARIGAYTRLAPRVVVYDHCVLGERCIVHSGAVIGADGFGFAPAGGQWEKIEQLGAVRIGHDVEIGANTCIDRGALDDTVIEDGVKLDNQIQIGHNVHVGAHTAMAGCAGVAGSAKIGRHCMIGGSAMILGHLELADGVQVSTGTAVTRSILKPGLYSGLFPFDDNANWEKNAATLRQLYRLRERIRALEKKIS